MGVLEKFTDSGEKTHIFILSNDKRIELDAIDIENIFKGYRPRNMSLEDFKGVSKIIKKEVRSYLKGQLVHLSKVDASLWKNYYEKGLINTHKQRGYTYVKERDEERRTEESTD
jgi:hypothetical protein